MFRVKGKVSLECLKGRVLLLWVMCQFVSSLSSISGRGRRAGDCLEGWREESGCALPKVKPACVGRRWHDGAVALLGTEPAFLFCSDYLIKLSALVYCGPRPPSARGPFTAFCYVGLTFPKKGGGVLCMCREGKEFKLRVNYEEEVWFWWGNWILKSWGRCTCRVKMAKEWYTHQQLSYIWQHIVLIFIKLKATDEEQQQKEKYKLLEVTFCQNLKHDSGLEPEKISTGC